MNLLSYTLGCERDVSFIFTINVANALQSNFINSLTVEDFRLELNL